MKLQSREETEDFFHDVIADILTDIDKSNIRPAYQKTKQPLPAGSNFVSQNGLANGIMPYENTTDFVYFYVKMDDGNDLESEVSADNHTEFIRQINVIVYCYGENSSNNALKLKALMRSQHIQFKLNYNGYYQLEEDNISNTFEDIHGEWWERNDVIMHFTCKAEFDYEPEDAPVIAKTDNKQVLINGGELNG